MKPEKLLDSSRGVYVLAMLLTLGVNLLLMRAPKRGARLGYSGWFLILALVFYACGESTTAVWLLLCSAIYAFLGLST